MVRRAHDTQVGQLRAERARYERALRREVGDDVPLARVLDEASDWRGRAQQITLLQERLLSIQEAQARPCTVQALVAAKSYRPRWNPELAARALVSTFFKATAFPGLPFAMRLH